MAEKVLVTGGAGFIGSHVVDAYVESGLQVVVVDNLSTGQEANLNPRARFYQVDLRDPRLAEVFDRERPHYVNHHAAQASVHLSMEAPHRDAETNILGALHLLESCRRTGVRKVIYSSSGGAIYGDPTYLPADESHPIRPLSIYGVSKYAFELYLYLYCHNYELNYTVLRYPNIYGPRQDPQGEAGVIAIFSQKMLRGEPVAIFGTGEQERDYLYVEDVARANLLVLKGGDGRTYNLGWGKGITVNEIFRQLKALTGYPGEPLYQPVRKGDVSQNYLLAARAWHDLGWKPQIDLEEGLRRTVAYFRASSSPAQRPSL